MPAFEGKVIFLDVVEEGICEYSEEFSRAIGS